MGEWSGGWSGGLFISLLLVWRWMGLDAGHWILLGSFWVPVHAGAGGDLGACELHCRTTPGERRAGVGQAGHPHIKGFRVLGLG
jgi:hypothetical protein